MKLSPIIFFTIIANHPTVRSEVEWVAQHGSGLHVRGRNPQKANTNTLVASNVNTPSESPREVIASNVDTPSEVPKDYARAPNKWPFVGSPTAGCCLSGDCHCPFMAMAQNYGE
mmetsp:Transcript_67853/g.75963  ORF Transcript_67853/g.75963 Transcript_67853/m.75963 type:complete len:114 (-) Transcript_67853:182-523(-)